MAPVAKRLRIDSTGSTSSIGIGVRASTSSMSPRRELDRDRRPSLHELHEPAQGRQPAVLVVAEPRVLLEERSEEHTSELQSRLHLVCRLLLEKKKNAQLLWARYRALRVLLLPSDARSRAR